METHRLEKKIRHDLSIGEAFLCKLLVEESVCSVIPGVVVVVVVVIVIVIVIIVVVIVIIILLLGFGDLGIRGILEI